ncbi:MAG: RNA methyltransferase [Clostridiaceae bacterium]|nr:RNA methyltransferase [Clostridiaceae bacterium]
MERITSRQNALITHIERLSSDPSYRAQRGEFVCEGEKLLREALVSGVAVTAAVFHEETALTAAYEGIPRMVCVPASLFERMTTLKHARGVVFTCAMPAGKPIAFPHGQVLCLDGVQDPGNVGTVLRTADAFGIDAVFLVGACADLYNPKTVRATMGSLFRVPVVRTDAEGFLSVMEEAGLPVYAAALSPDSRDIRDVSLARAAVIVGSEGAGVSPYLQSAARARIIIPMRGVTESLNAAVAAAIVLWSMQTAL